MGAVPWLGAVFSLQSTHVDRSDQAGAVRSGPCNGDPDAVETCMSPLALTLTQRSILKRQALTVAQMAHLRHSASRGVDTSAHLSPAVLNTPSPAKLAELKRAAREKSTAYRGIDTTNQIKPIPNKRGDRGLVYRGQAYNG